MEFTATESGFVDGMGGAASAASATDYHYVLFGRQTDEQHPEWSAVYFEFDDQIHGSVGNVTRVAIADGLVRFELRDGQTIAVRRGMAEPQGAGFLRGIHEAFGDEIIAKA